MRNVCSRRFMNLQRMTFRFTAILTLFLLYSNSYAECKLHPQLELGLLVGLKEYSEVTREHETSKYAIERDGDNLTAMMQQISLMYDITPGISAGIGVGLYGYSEPVRNALPIFASMSYFPLQKRNWFLFSDIGYSIKFADDFYKGYMFDFGVGYHLKFKEHFGMNFKFYYNIKQFKQDSNVYEYATDESGIMTTTLAEYQMNHWRHSLALCIGVTF